MLLDIERIAPCLPGAQLQEIEGDEYRGIVKVKVGPITAQYKGAAKHRRGRRGRRAQVVIAGQGRDTRGQGNASATIIVTLAPDGDGTTVDIDTDLTITGKVAQFGRGVMADVSSKLLGQFVENLERDVLDRRRAGRRAPTPRPAADRRRSTRQPPRAPADAGLAVAPAPSRATGRAQDRLAGGRAGRPASDAAGALGGEAAASPIVAGARRGRSCSGRSSSAAKRQSRGVRRADGDPLGSNPCSIPTGPGAGHRPGRVALRLRRGAPRRRATPRRRPTA